MRSLLLHVALLFGLSMLLAPTAYSHSMPPSLLQLEETGESIFLFWKTAVKNNGYPMSPEMPAGCHFKSPPTIKTDSISATLSGYLSCESSNLNGHSIRITNIENNITPVIFRYKTVDEVVISSLINVDQTSFVIPDKKNTFQLMIEYIELGAEHLVRGVDHVLFVIALFLLIRRTGALVEAITCFTIGHSISLALSTLNIISVNAALVEVLIAGSITLMALEIVKKAQHRQVDSFTSLPYVSFFERYVWSVATGFGILHGLGFATVLSGFQLPQGELVTALFSFNVGIELGQLSVIAVCIAIKYLLKIGKAEGRLLVVNGPRYIAYGFGSLSAFWVIERTQVILLGG